MSMFTVSLHTTASKNTTDIIISILISLAILKPLCIIAVHIKNSCHGNIRESNCGVVIKISRYFGKLTSTRNPQKSIELVNAVPEVKYNYKEFQEPLIGQD